MFEKLQHHYNGDLQGKTIALWGLAFKPETDDIRESPAIVIARTLIESGRFVLQLYDPKAMRNARRQLGESEQLVWCSNVAETLEGADGIIIATEWAEFNALDFGHLKSILKKPVLFDFRNIYQKQDVQKNGWEYYGTGV